ncbi:MAG: GC-type dockerin domain-anchored protein [Phycisphaerales bacterium]
MLDHVTLVFQREDLLLPALRDGPWDLVIIRWFDAFEGPLAGDIIAELASHVDGGGKLMFSMAQLDEQPEVWPILGIDAAVDVEEPLQDIFTVHGRDDPTRRHPAFRQLGWRVNDDPFLPPTSDYGDWLEPGGDASVIAEFVDDSTGAIVVSRDGAVIVNGQHWDYWESGILTAERQLEWLLGCPADLDADGDLTVFDFFEFQNRFDSGGSSGFADFDYDGMLDVFDFLEFFNLFESGC